MSDFDEELQAAEKFFSRRKYDREPYYIDARPGISSDAFDRANAKAWKICKVAMGCVAFSAFVYAVFYWFGGLR